MDAFPTRGRRIRCLLLLASLTIDRRDRISLLAGALALIGVIILAIGVLAPHWYVLTAGIALVGSGAGTLAGQRRRAKARA